MLCTVTWFPPHSTNESSYPSLIIVLVLGLGFYLKNSLSYLIIVIEAYC
jgi:hypothetical protein